MSQLKKKACSIKLLELINKKVKDKIFFFFDYDGVLVPLKKDPTTTFLPSKTRALLYKISSLENIKVALVSGRDLKTLKNLSSIKNKNITLVGSHGLELFKDKRNSFLESKTSRVQEVKEEIVKSLHGVANGFVENKPFSFTFHVRDKRKFNFVKMGVQCVKKILKEKKLNKEIKVLPGKLMVEIISRKVDKGKAVEKLIKENPGFVYVYFGDDVTDVYAFKKIRKHKGIVVSLNSELNFKADVYFKNSIDVRKFISLYLQKQILLH